ILQRLGVPAGQILQQVEAKLAQQPKVSGGTGQPGLSGPAQTMLNTAWKSAQDLKDEYLSTEHIVLGMLNTRGDAAGEILKSAGVTEDGVLSALKDIRGTQRVTDPNAEDTYEALTKY